MARVDATAWLKSQVNSLRKTHSDVATALKNLITGQTASLSPGVWAPNAGGWTALATRPAGAATWDSISGANGWAAITGSAQPAILLLPGNLVLFQGTMTCGTLTGTTQILNTFPSWAWPNCPVRVPVGTTGGGSVTNGPYIVVNTDGTVTVGSLPASPANAGWCVIYSTDSPVH